MGEFYHHYHHHRNLIIVLLVSVFVSKFINVMRLVAVILILFALYDELKN
jgi:hypothetical protein